jgi:hypothetical protein
VPWPVAAAGALAGVPAIIALGGGFFDVNTARFPEIERILHQILR